MTDPLFLILKSLSLLTEMLSRIFSVIFINYFPDTPPDKDDDNNELDLSL